MRRPAAPETGCQPPRETMERYFSTIASVAAIVSGERIGVEERCTCMVEGAA